MAPPDIPVILPQGLHHLQQGEIAVRQGFGVNPHFHLSPSPPWNNKLANPLHPTQAGDNDFLHQIAVMVWVALMARRGLQGHPHHRCGAAPDNFNIGFPSFRRQFFDLLQFGEDIHQTLIEIPIAVEF